MNKKFIWYVVAAFIIGLVGSYMLGATNGNKAGYEKAVADAK